MLKGRTIVLLLLFVAGFVFANGQKEKATPQRMSIEWFAQNSRGQLLRPNSPTELWLEQRFDVDIEPWTDVDAYEPTQINVKLASGDIPDFYESLGVGISAGVQSGYIREIPITAIEKYMPNQVAAVRKVMGDETFKFTAFEGKNYGIPRVNLFAYTPTILNYRKDWAEKLGVDIKDGASFADLERMLLAFSKRDPDGNGVNDTYGLGVHKNNNNLGGINGHSLFGTIFGGFNVRIDAWMVEDGKVIYSQTHPRFLEALKYLNSWYQKGIIDPLFVSDLRKQLIDKWANEKVGAFFENNAWSGFRKDTGPHAALLTQHPDAKIGWLVKLVGPYGAGSNGQSAYWGSSHIGFGVSDEKMNRILQIWEAICTDEEVYARVNFGIEGQDYEWKNGVLTVLPGAQTAEELMTKGLQYFGNGTNIIDMATKYKLADWRVDVYKYAKQYDNLIVDLGYTPPPLPEELGNQVANLNALEEEFFYKAIAGAYPNLDAAWGEFLRSWKAAGGDRLTDFVQKSYDAGL